MSRLEFAPGSIDLVVASYSIIHLPGDHHEALFGSIGRWLRPGGQFVAALDSRDNPGGTDAD
jgi:SAM-dependent methyltransferase